MNHQHRILAFCVGFVGLCAPAWAGSGFDLTPSNVDMSNLNVTAPQTSDAWKFTVKPYLWAASISGDIKLKNQPRQDIDVSFSDILDNLQFAGMVGFEAKKENSDFTFIGDMLYLELQDEKSNVDVRVQQFMTEADIAYQLPEPKWLEVLAGARYWYFWGEIDPSGPGSFSKSQDWVDPIIGLRATFHPFNERWTGQWRVDGGGFGVGSQSTYQVWGGMQYAFSEALSVTAGFRTLNINYDGDNDSNYDVTMSGPWMGILWSF